MSPLRILGFCYLATASLLVLAIATADHERLRAALDGAGATVSRRLDRTLWRYPKLFDPPRRQARLELAPPGPGEGHSQVRPALPPPAPERLIDHKSPASKFAAAGPLLTIAPDLPALEPVPAHGREGASALRADVQMQLEQRLTPELRANFDLYLFVSKAASGPAAQRLYVFKKEKDGALALAYDWAASTGREAHEISPQGRRVFTATPRGLYQFDPARLYRHYVSRAWDGEMPFAMFLNWVRHGAKTGIAIHAATGAGIARLGRRTSAGCIHLSPKHAEILFKLIQADYRGRVPRFAYDAESRSSSNRGELMRDPDGKLVMMDGYRVLVDIEDYSGREVVAGLE